MEQVIQEIATQLGIAASEVEGHVAELFPLVASAMTARAIGIGSVTLIVFTVSTVATIALCTASTKTKSVGFGEFLSTVALVSGGVAIVTFILNMFVIPDMIAYIIEPEGTAILNLLEMLTK